MQYKEALTIFKLPTIKNRLQILKCNLFRHIVDKDVQRLHYFLPKASFSKENSVLN